MGEAIMKTPTMLISLSMALGLIFNISAYAADMKPNILLNLMSTPILHRAHRLLDVIGILGTATYAVLANRPKLIYSSVLVWEGECDGTSTALCLSAAVSGSNMLIFPTQGFQVLQHSN